MIKIIIETKETIKTHIINEFPISDVSSYGSSEGNLIVIKDNGQEYFYILEDVKNIQITKE